MPRKLTPVEHLARAESALLLAKSLLAEEPLPGPKRTYWVAKVRTQLRQVAGNARSIVRNPGANGTQLSRARELIAFMDKNWPTPVYKKRCA